MCGNTWSECGVDGLLVCGGGKSRVKECGLEYAERGGVEGGAAKDKDKDKDMSLPLGVEARGFSCRVGKGKRVDRYSLTFVFKVFCVEYE